jgi:hypothetical protein
MSTLISSNDSATKESHDENDRRTPLSQPPPTKPPLSSSFTSAALVAHRQHSPLERRSSSVLANRTALSNQLIRTPIQTYLPSLQVVYGQSVGSDEARGVMSEKVQMLAASIYKELERMIQKNGEDSVKVSVNT